MRRFLALAAALFTLPALAAPLPLHPTARGVVQGAIDGAIEPGFGTFAARAHQLALFLDLGCGLSPDALDKTRALFADTVASWSAVELYNVGPLTEQHRAERILFWPDRKGIALKQVQGLLAAKDQTATTADSLAGKSVAVQGLAALEYLLYGTGSDALASGADPYRCAYATASASGLATLGKDLADAWSDKKGFSARLLYPAAADPDYRTSAEVQEALVGMLAHGSETVRDQRLLPFFGRDGEAPKPKSALFWRSNETLPSILANFSGLKTLFDASELGNYVPEDYADLAPKIEAQFDRIAAAGAKVTSPVEAALADPAQKAALDEIVAASQSLQDLFGEQLPSALGLSVGFSSLDGD